MHRSAGAEREAVHETELRPLPHGAERPFEAGQVAGRSPIRPISIAGMATSATASAWARTPFASRSAWRQTLTRFPVVHFLEKILARAGVQPVEVEENAHSHDGASPAAGTPHFVDACDQADATRRS